MEKCRYCPKYFNRVEFKSPSGRKQYKDPVHGMWLGRHCPDCVRSRAIEYGRKCGHAPVDLVTDPRNRKGRDNEILAKSFLESFGFYCELGNGKGPDIVARSPEGVFLIEVKTVGIEKKSWRVKAVCNKRKKDDAICYVWPSGYVDFILMSEHLSKVNGCGERYLGVTPR